MKRTFATVALMLAGTAHAQAQTYCNRSGAQVTCQSYNTGAPEAPGSSSNTITYGGHQYQVQTSGQPVAPPPPSSNVADTMVWTPPAHQRSGSGFHPLFLPVPH
jgi:hypothetical protein